MQNAKIETRSSTTEPVARFGAFELRLVTGELRKHGVRIHLQTKPFHLLRALVEQAGLVVTRDELKERLWASDTFVDFESGLNTAVNRLRTALGDSADTPIYIETLSRIGYRFVAPVSVESPDAQPAPESGLSPAPAALFICDNPATHPEKTRPPSLEWIVTGFVSLFVLSLVGTFISHANSVTPRRLFHQITFREGFVNNARFTPGAKSVVFSATWGFDPSQLFVMPFSKFDPQALGFRGARLISLSPAGDLAVLSRQTDSEIQQLEVVSLPSGSSARVLHHAAGCDFAPDGTLGLVKNEDAVFSIEYPPGRKIYTARSGWISNLRIFSRNKIAFAEHPIIGDDAGQVMLVDSSGEARALSMNWSSLDGLAWHPSGREVWFTAASSGVERGLIAVDLKGRMRQVTTSPGGLQLLDIAPSGEALIGRTTAHITMTLRDVSQSSGQDISWLDWSRAAGITPDGNTVLFDESGSGGGKDYSVYLYRTRRNSTQRVGSGRAMDISPDGNWVLTQSSTDPAKLLLISTANGKAASVVTNGLAYRWAKFVNTHNALQIMLEASLPGRPLRIYRQELPNGSPVPLNTPVIWGTPIVSEAGELAGASNSEPGITVFNPISGNARTIRTSKAAYPMAFLNDNMILTGRSDHGSIVLEYLDLQTGQSSLYRRLESPAGTGVTNLFPIFIARDLRTLVYSRMQNLSDLFIATGLR